MSFNQFQRNIKTLVDSFERAREWADLNNCLQKLKRILEKNDAESKHEIEDIPSLAKRLAQCLSPDFNVIHKTTLEIYKMIFQSELQKRRLEAEEGKQEEGDNYTFGSGLGVLLSGLFGFYQYAAFEVKEKFLDIVEEEILMLVKELHVCLGGFMVCILPALDDQSETITKKVEEILNKTEEIVGTKMFYGTIWMTLMRSSRTRIGGFKYIEKYIPKSLDACRRRKIYPIKMVIKCFENQLHIKSATESDILVEEKNRLKNMEAEDYYYFYYPQKSKLVINALIACMMDPSVYVNRMVLDFINTHLGIHSDILKIEENSILVESALNLITKKDFACLKKFSNWLLSHLEDEEFDVDYNFDGDKAIEAIVPALISIFSERPRNARNASLSITMIQTLLYENALITDAVMDKVTVEVIDYIQDYMIGNDGTRLGEEFLTKFNETTANFFEHIGTQLSSVLKALGRNLSEKMDSGNVEEALKSIQRIEFSLTILNLERVEDVNDLLRPILSRILASVNKLSKGMREPKNTIPALNLALVILQNIKDEKANIAVEEEELAENIERFNKFFSDLCSCIINDYADSALSEVDELNSSPLPPSPALLSTLKLACRILYQVQIYASADNMEADPDWLQKLLKCCKSDFISVSILASEIFLSFILRKNIVEKGPYYQIKSIIYCGKKDQAELMQTEYLKCLQGKKEVHHQNEHCYEIIVRLWKFLEEEQYNEEIVSLLKNFDVNLPEIVSDVVSKDLSDKNKTDRIVKAINKFSTYWNLTSDKYPHYAAFPDGNSLFQMLEYLEAGIPSVRLASKSWLNISTSNFRRILDPLLSILCNSQTDVVTNMQDEMFFTEVYDSRQIVQCFSKFRSIVLNSQNELIGYTLSNEVTPAIMTKFREVFKYVELVDETYYQILIQVCVKFIVGHIKQGEISKYATDTHSVNATACEFLELILRSSKESDVTAMVAAEILPRILKALSVSIEKHDNAMQVQLLNLLKVILFECTFKDDTENCRMVLSNEMFSDILVHGMNNQVSYVRQHFIEFVVQIVPMITEMLQEAEAVAPITKLVLCLINILRKVDLSIYGEDTDATGGRKEEVKGGHSIRATVLIWKQDQMNTNRHVNENLLINSEVDIQLIIEGIKSIIYHCLHIHPDSSDLKFTEEYEYVEGSGFSFKTIFGGGEGHDKLIDKSSKLTPLKESVLQLLKPLFISCISCWKDLCIFLPKDYLFSRIGVISYRNEDQSATNMMLRNKLRDLEGTDDAAASTNLEEEEESKGKKKSKKKRKKKKKDTPSKAMGLDEINGSLKSYIDSEANPTHKMLINILKPIAFCYPNQLIQEILVIWIRKEDIQNLNVNLCLIKLIQILSCLELPLYAVIGALNYNIEKMEFASKKVAQKKKVILEREELQKESLIFFFLYTYILHNLQFYFKTEDDTKIYRLFLKFLKYYQYSRHPTTICWMLETLYILSQKYSPKEAYLSEKKIKKDYQDLMQMLTENVARIISDDLNIGFSPNYCLTFVYPPSMYEHLKAWTVLVTEDKKEEEGITISQFLGTHINTVKSSAASYEKLNKFSTEIMLMNELLEEDKRLLESDTSDNIVSFVKDLLKSQNIDNSDLRLPPNFLKTFFSYYTVQTMKNLFFSLLHNVLLSSSQEKIVYNLDTIVGVIIHILQRKRDHPPVLTDIVTELFAGLMKNADAILVKTYRKQISEIFFSDSFFDSSSRALNKWKTIIEYYMNHEKNDLIDDIISKWNTSAGMFTSKHYETKQKCTAIKRVAFLLYSSATDHYLDKIDLLLKKMTENFKMNHLDSKVRIQLLLLCRIILLRLSDENLIESLRKLWPNLLNELISIMENNNKKNEEDDDYALTLEALKLIEILSLLNLEDFQLNQWIFLLDSYNVNKASFTNNEMKIARATETDKYFTPYIVPLMDAHSDFDFNEVNEDEYARENIDSHFEEEKDRYTSISRNSKKYAIVEMSHVASECTNPDSHSIKLKAETMQVKASARCTEMSKLDWKNAEQVIENDFIDSNQVQE
ncbi:unnamed protein product [Moneuplotes crassus]|uniref:Dopey N-terminal domain-containing protein n=3 Tax=Euplotes crassus TaxID=5936 RepID=A0AAD2D772_EUPCR|nr:unnamed protein product [Moneuplotes crassus]